MQGRIDPRSRPGLLAALLCLIALAAQTASAGERGPFRCETRHESLRAFALSEASFDFYHGIGWLAGGAAISFAADTDRRWTAENGFDSGIQSALRLDSVGARRNADTASDVFLAFGLGILPAAAIGTAFARDHDCVETWEMIGETFESFSLALFVAEAVKVASGRERPYGDRCDDGPPRDARCGGEDRNLAFPSGHATLAAAGAGLTCRFALQREAFGPGRAARFAPCTLGIASALVAGTLRINSDRHWATDVLVGFGAGALIGAFDMPGPLDAFRFEKRGPHGRIETSGAVLPLAREGRLGVQWTMIY